MTEKLNTQLKSSLPVECRGCIPLSPFYVRWLNRFGGLDYWMFEVRQEFKRKQNSYEEFEPYITDYSRASGTNYQFSKEVSEHITVGASQLNNNEWYEISRITYSSLVQWYDERTRSWIDIIIDKADNVLFTDLSFNEIEISFILPKPQLQF